MPKQVVRLHDIYGGQIDYEPELWESLWEEHRYSYIGKCVAQGDQVFFTGDIEEGSLRISDNGETVTMDTWSQVEVPTDEEQAIIDEEDFIYMNNLESE